MVRIRCGAVALVVWLLLMHVGGPSSFGAEPLNRSDRFAARGREMVTPACRESIASGTEWLISAMRIDGSLGSDVGMPPDLSCTAIGGLALLAQGNTLVAGPRLEEFRKVTYAVLDLVERVPMREVTAPTVTLVQRKIGRHADLFVAALFLSQLLGEAGYADKDARLALEKLVLLIGRGQRSDGTWGSESWAPVLGTVLGWESLRAASSAGMRVDASATAAGKALLKQLRAANRQDANWMFRLYKNASSIRVLYSMNHRDDPAYQECVRRIVRIAQENDRPFAEAGGEEYLAFFLVTECLLQERGAPARSWYPTVRDKLIRVQNLDGSWTGHHCIKDRTFCTAAALLTLEAANLYMPTSNL